MFPKKSDLHFLWSFLCQCFYVLLLVLSLNNLPRVVVVCVYENIERTFLLVNKWSNLMTQSNKFHSNLLWNIYIISKFWKCGVKYTYSLIRPGNNDWIFILFVLVFFIVFSFSRLYFLCWDFAIDVESCKLRPLLGTYGQKVLRFL